MRFSYMCGRFALSNEVRTQYKALQNVFGTRQKAIKKGPKCALDMFGNRHFARTTFQPPRNAFLLPGTAMEKP